MTRIIRQCVVVFLAMTVLTGIVYPLAATGLSQLLFPAKANGSLVQQGDKTVGSSLIGQPFTEPGYFWGRPSATSPTPYNGANSSGSNQGPTNPALADAARQRLDALKRADPSNTARVPVDLVTASGSGLDPEISPAAAEYQVSRIARVRGIEAGKVRQLIAAHTSGRQFGVLGEPRVNVLALNLALDATRPTPVGARPARDSSSR